MYPVCSIVSRWIGKSFCPALQEQARAQQALVEACCARIASAPRPELRSVWVAAVTKLVDGSIATALAMGALERAPSRTLLSALPLRLRLPAVPRLPDVEGDPPPPAFFPKTTAGGNLIALNVLQNRSPPPQGGEGGTLRSAERIVPGGGIV